MRVGKEEENVRMGQLCSKGRKEMRNEKMD